MDLSIYFPGFHKKVRMPVLHLFIRKLVRTSGCLVGIINGQQLTANNRNPVCNFTEIYCNTCTDLLYKCLNKCLVTVVRIMSRERWGYSYGNKE
jgi:hypothetical protein